jgi:PPK2 family polyphosphate:nucleotide phosphotransferase
MASSVAAEAVDRLDARRRRLTGTWSLMTEHWQIAEGASVDLSEIDPHTCEAAPGGKRETRAASDRLRRELRDLQKRLYAEDSRAVLVVLQAMDAGGKDGAIRKAFSGLNPQGCRVHTFNKPTEEELAHDFLWRIHPRCPRKGTIGIFNRSHYEEVLVVRVHQENLDRQRLPGTSAGKNMWARRFREINDWERYLTDNGFAVVKLFLNLSWEEQRARFLKRIDVPDRNWKFSAADIRERRFWKDYQHAFSEMLSATSKPWAPWHVIPADRKWFARLCVGAVLAHTLIELDPQYPRVSAEARDELRKARAELEAEEKPPTAAGGSRRA